MIDTDKYEGHTPAPWKAKNDFYNGIDENNLGEVASFRRTWGVTLSDEPLDDGRKNHIGYYTMHIADAQLIADAPLLLEEVKRLRGIIDYIRDVGRMRSFPHFEPLLASIMEKVLTTEEYLEWRNEE